MHYLRHIFLINVHNRHLVLFLVLIFLYRLLWKTHPEQFQIATLSNLHQNLILYYHSGHHTLLQSIHGLASTVSYLWNRGLHIQQH